MDTTGNQQQQATFTPSYPYQEEPSVLESEVRWAYKTSPKNKAPGVDNRTTEAIIACGELSILWLTKLFQKAWEEWRMPDDCQRATVRDCKSKRDCDKCRQISPLSHEGKMYAKILEQRARYMVEPHLCEAQFGLRKGRSCTDAIFTLQQLSEKATEYNKDLSIIFIV